MLTNEIIRLQAEAQQDYVIESRRTIHRFAEVSGKEFKTSAFIEEEIKKAGLPYEKAGDTGWIAILDTGKPGSRIALRADIDALLVPEEPNNLAGPRVVVSDDPHTSHACGHDAHTAMLLGAMRVLAEQRDNLTGVIYFCFEEGEEDGRGILAMLNQLSAHGVDVCWESMFMQDLNPERFVLVPVHEWLVLRESALRLSAEGDMAPDRICR